MKNLTMLAMALVLGMTVGCSKTVYSVDALMADSDLLKQTMEFCQSEDADRGNESHVQLCTNAATAVQQAAMAYAKKLYKGR